MKQQSVLPVSCNRDCITGCPLEALVEDGVLTRIRNSSYKTAHMNGCMRGFRFPSTVYHPDRLTQPLIATGRRGKGQFREAPWDEALDLVAERIRHTHAEYGPEAVMRIGGSGACRGALHHTANLTKRFLALSGGYTDTHGSFSSAATDFVKPYMYGTGYVGIDVKTLLYSRLIILWGFNAADTRFSPEIESVLGEAKQRGIPIVVIDPRRTRTVKRFADQWIPIYPGTDTALMQALLYCILREDLEDRDFIRTHSVGFEELEANVLGKDDTPPKSSKWAAELSGVPAREIEQFARRYAAAQPAALLPGLSIQRTLGGEDADRMAGVLQLALGNVGLLGGSTGAGQWNVLPGPRCGKLPVPPNPAGSSVPVYRWADAVLNGRAGGYPSDIKLLYNVGGNYAVQGSNSRKALRALEQAEFVVSHDYFLTDTARSSDVVLPVSTFVERSDIIYSHCNYLYYSAAAIPPVGGARHDFDIFAELSCRLGFPDAFTGEKSAQEWLDHLLQDSDVDDKNAFFKKGIYAGKDQYRVGLADFSRSPAEYPLATESGLIEVSCRGLEAAGGNRIPLYHHYSEGDGYSLKLVTPHDRFRNNSQFDNIEEFARSAERGVQIHPQDAVEYGIDDGDRVILSSPVGKMYSTARLTSDIMPGVLSISQGRWFDRRDPKSEPTEPGKEPGPTEHEKVVLRGEVIEEHGLETGSWRFSVNAPTSSRPTLPSQGSRTHSTMVNICKNNELHEAPV